MNAIDLLTQPGDAEFTPDEEALIFRHLALAYQMDEAAAFNPELKRVADKVRRRIAEAEASGGADQEGKATN